MKALANAPEHTAVRTALWRALHLLIDDKPHVLTDDLGAKIVGEVDWTARADMDPDFSKSMRASVTGRARFVEDLVVEEIKKGVLQYVILGAGLDTFALRTADPKSSLRIYEVDQPGPQAWKKLRLSEVGFVIPSGLHFVSVDFEAGESWRTAVLEAGFNKDAPAVVASTGVSMYLSRDANAATFRETAIMAPGSTFVTTFMLTLELLDAKERAIMDFVMKKAGESGTPFLSLFSPEDILGLAKDVGFKEAKVVSGQNIYDRYFKGRTDGLNPGKAENFLVAKV